MIRSWVKLPVRRGASNWDWGGCKLGRLVNSDCEWVLSKLMHNLPAEELESLLPIHWIKARAAEAAPEVEITAAASPRARGTFQPERPEPWQNAKGYVDRLF